MSSVDSLDSTPENAFESARVEAAFSVFDLTQVMNALDSAQVEWLDLARVEALDLTSSVDSEDV